IAGLSTAYALATSGHRVRVLEKSELGTRPSAGIQVPPNLTKILHKWGMEEELKQKCSVLKESYTIYMDTGEKFGYLPWAEEVQNESGAPFYLMRHSDLLDLLRRLALSAGVEIIHDSCAQAVSVSSTNPAIPGTNQPSPSVTLANGQTLHADVVVGADGSFSIVRRSVEDRPTLPTWDGTLNFATVIPMEEIRRDEDTNKDEVTHGWPLWCGNNNAAFDSLYSMHMWFESTLPDTEEGWTPNTSPSHFKDQFPQLDVRLSKLMDKMTSVSWVRRLKWPKLENWIDKSGHVVLVGDAARPSGAGATHAASAAVESGAVLGTLFSYLRSYDQIPTLLYAYQELRQDRTQDLEDTENVNVASRMLPPGPERDARDEHMKLSLVDIGRDVWNDEGLSRQWWQNYIVWAYNAFDAADDWWVKWGAPQERSLAGDNPHLGIRFDRLEVTLQHSSMNP
ncbi:hypothetical protein OF83DRAFT_1134160, partial [Amylostereum chailletii]